MLAIYKKEMRSYFSSIIGWLFLTFFFAFIGFFHYYYNYYYESAIFAYVLSNVTMFFVLLVPMLTMRVMAEENRQKTDQLLFTAPVTITKIILGKFLAVMSVVGIGMAVISLYPLMMSRFGTVNFKWAYIAIFGFLLLAGAYMSIGMYISSKTESQAFAAVMTFIVVLVTCLIDNIIMLLPSDNKSAWIIFAVVFLLITALIHFMMKNVMVTAAVGVIGEVVLAVLYFVKPEIYDNSVATVFGWLSMLNRYGDMVSGIMDVSDIVYFLSVMALFVFLTIQNIKKRRWS